MKLPLILTAALLTTFASGAMAEVPEGASMNDDTVIPPVQTVSESHKGCKIVCLDAKDVVVTYEGGDASITGCQKPLETAACGK